MSDNRIEDKLIAIHDELHEVDIHVAVLNTSLSEHTKNDDRNMNDIHSELKDVNTRLDEYNKLLDVHIQGVVEAKRQNDLLQEQVALYKEFMDNTFKTIGDKLVELEKPKIIIIGIVKIITALAALGGLLTLLKNLR